MKRWLSSILALCLSVSVVFGEARIPYEDRIPNEAPGYCCWAAIETAARAQGIRQLYNLKESRKADPDGYIERAVKDPYSGSFRVIDSFYVPASGGTIDSVLAKFTEVGYFNYHYQRMGNFSTALIENAISKGHGAIIQVNWRDAQGGGCHAVLVTDLTDEYVKFVNSNNLQEEVRSRDWFNKSWDGFTITLE